MGRLLVLVLVLGVAVPAFLLAPQTPLGEGLWPEPTHDARAEGGQVPLFGLLGVLEALTFGAAVAFLVLGWRHTRAVTGGGAFGLAVHLSIAWVLGNFWLHDGLHYVNGIDLDGLLVIDYLFHVPLMAAGSVLAWAAVRLSRERTGETAIHAAQRGARGPARTGAR